MRVICISIILANILLIRKKLSDSLGNAPILLTRILRRLRFPVVGVSVVFFMVILSACSTPPQGIPMKAVEVQAEAYENKVPGTVDRVWQEPMYNQVQVPAQLDPNGVYYRPSHNALVEIRKDKFQKLQFPSDKLMKVDQYHK